jgi:hypothetical protein
VKTLSFLCAAAGAFLFAPALLVAQGSGRQGSGGEAEAHKPPPGTCRIWLDGVPAAKQPAPTDCATALKNKPANATVIFGDEKPGAKPTVRPPLSTPARPAKKDSVTRRDSTKAPPRVRRDTLTSG